MQYTVEQAKAINQWVEQCVGLVLTNDRGAYEEIRGNLIEGYDPEDGWDFRAPFMDWLEQLDIESAAIMLLIDLLDLSDQEMNSALVALFLDEDERAAVERDHGDVVDYFATHSTEPEYTVTVPARYEDDPVVEIGISAAGGGTVGKAYRDNSWIYGVWCDGELMVSGDDVRSPVAVGATHEEMAVTLAAFLAHDADIIRDHGVDSAVGREELVGYYTRAGREFLESEGDRIGDWGALAGEPGGDN